MQQAALCGDALAWGSTPSTPVHPLHPACRLSETVHPPFHCRLAQGCFRTPPLGRAPPGNLSTAAPLGGVSIGGPGLPAQRRGSLREVGRGRGAATSSSSTKTSEPRSFVPSLRTEAQASKWNRPVCFGCTSPSALVCMHYGVIPTGVRLGPARKLRTQGLKGCRNSCSSIARVRIGPKCRCTRPAPERRAIEKLRSK